MIEEESKTTSLRKGLSDLDYAMYMTTEAMADFKVFLSWVLTKDEAEGFEKCPWPTNKEYLNWLADSLQYREEQPAPVWIPKSRRLMLTWIMCAYILWRGMKNGATHSFIQSKKLGDADFLVSERVGYIYKNLPYWLRYCAMGKDPTPHEKEAQFNLPNGAMIWGFPEGADVARQFTPSILFTDEAAKQPKFEEAVTAIMPLAEKKTELYFVSTARPGCFGEACESDPATEIVSPIRGIKTWDLVHGGTVWQIHYTADKDKDPETETGRLWKEDQNRRWLGGVHSTDWLQEMEIQFGAKAGQLVYPSFIDTVEGDGSSLVEPFPISLFTERIVTVDWGVRNPTCVLWVGKLHNTYYVYREFYEVAPRIDTFKKMFWSKSVYMQEGKMVEEKFGRIIIDPASDRHDRPGATTVFTLLRTGRNSIPATKANRSEDGIDLVKQWLYEEKLKIFTDCTHTRWEFGKYRWQDYTSITQMQHNLKEKIVDKDNHAMDCLKYFANLKRLSEGKMSREQTSSHQSMIDKILDEDELAKRYYGREQYRETV